VVSKSGKKMKLMSQKHDHRSGAEQPDEVGQTMEPDEKEATIPTQEVSLPSSHDSMTRDTVLAACQVKTWRPDPTVLLSFGEDEHAPATEVFRALRSRLSQLQRNSPLKSILVASAVANEGRSFVALNLAQVLALQPECRVLLIDADLRSPSLHSMLGTASSPGFSEYLLQEVEQFGVMQRGEAANLFFIPAGRAVTTPTELVANNRLRLLIEQVDPLFDWIIVDSPAALPVSDAGLLANYCEGVLMVVRSHSTPSDLVRKARERFRDESLVGVVLNEMHPDPKPPRRFWGRRRNSNRAH
jgi:capsular exopolysaccharide synthesis family protein